MAFVLVPSILNLTGAVPFTNAAILANNGKNLNSIGIVLYYTLYTLVHVIQTHSMADIRPSLSLHAHCHFDQWKSV